MKTVEKDSSSLNRIPFTETNLSHTKQWDSILALYELLPKVLLNDVFLAGGAIRSYFTEQPVKDYDLYCRNEQAWEKLRTFFSRYDVKYQTSNATTYEVNLNEQFSEIQLIDAYYGDIFTVLNKFDFSVCQGAYDFVRQEFWVSDRFLLDNIQKKLVYNMHNEYPLSALSRTLKYREYGYTISNYELMKIAMKLSSLDMNDMQTFTKQLGGVSVRSSDSFSGCLTVADCVKQIMNPVTEISNIMEYFS